MNWSELNSRAYAPYSKKPRSCVVKSRSDNYYPGVRIENASFPITISAIQSALYNCLSEGDHPAEVIFESKDQVAELSEFWIREFDLKLTITGEIGDLVFADLQRSGKPEEAELLKKLLQRAIAIHSDFPVSAILYTPKGYFEGVNIEVSDWSLGLCAERVAISKALSYGVSELTAMAVHTRDGEFCSPCGSCRQVIIEHMPLKKMRCFHPDGSISEHFSSDFLPFSFSSDSVIK